MKKFLTILIICLLLLSCKDKSDISSKDKKIEKEDSIELTIIQNCIPFTYYNKNDYPNVEQYFEKINEKAINKLLRKPIKLIKKDINKKQKTIKFTYQLGNYDYSCVISTSYEKKDWFVPIITFESEKYELLKNGKRLTICEQKTNDGFKNCDNNINYSNIPLEYKIVKKS